MSFPTGPFVEVLCNTCGHYYETEVMYADQHECPSCRQRAREIYLKREQEDFQRYLREADEDEEFNKKHNQ